jgi:hypothetical protein
VTQSSRSTADPSMPWLLLPLPYLWALPMEAFMAHTPVDKTDVDEALALIEEVKAMIKMMEAEEAN